MAMTVKKTRPLTIAAPRWCNQTCWRRHIILSVRGSYSRIREHRLRSTTTWMGSDGAGGCVISACARAICSSCSRSFHDRSYIVLSATSSMRRERHESIMSSIMNGKGPLTPTEQALMRLHNYGCSIKQGYFCVLIGSRYHQVEAAFSVASYFSGTPLACTRAFFFSISFSAPLSSLCLLAYCKPLHTSRDGI